MPFYTNQQLEEFPPEIARLFADLRAQSQSLSKEPYVPYGYRKVPDPNNPGVFIAQEVPNRIGRIAPIPEDIRRAFIIGRNQVGEHRPYLDRAREQVERASDPFYRNPDRYMNPYNKHVVNRIAEEGMRTFNENIMPSLEAKFVRAGQHGSSRHQKMSERAARDIQNEIMARQQSSLERGYQQAGQLFNADQARRLATADQMGILGSLQKAGTMGDIKMLEEQGRYQQQQAQADRDLAYNEWQNEQAEPSRRFAERLAMVHGIPYEKAHTQIQQTPGTPQLNLPGQLANLAGNIYAARMFANR